MRQDLIASKSFTYAGRALVAGAAFSASRRDARVLIGTKRATPAGAYQTTEAQPVVTKAPAKTAAKTSAKKAPAKTAKKAAAK